MIRHNHERPELSVREVGRYFVPDIRCDIARGRGQKAPVSDFSEKMRSVFRTNGDEISGIIAVIPPLRPCRRDALFIFEFFHSISFFFGPRRDAIHRVSTPPGIGNKMR